MSFINSTLFLIAAFSLGTVFVAWLDEKKRLGRLERTVATLALGPVALGFVILIISLLTRDFFFSVFAGIVAGIIVGHRYLKKLDWREWAIAKWRPELPSPRLTFLLTILFLVYAGVIFQVMMWDSEGLPRAVLVGWGDSAYHMDIIGRLATADPWRLEQPIASGEPLTYPFMVDFLSTILKRLGVPQAVSWYFPMVVLGTSLFFLLFFVGRRVIRKDGLAIAFVFLVLFGGGLGFLWFFQDVYDAWSGGGAGAAWEAVRNPLHEYTHLDSRTGGKPASADAPLNIVWMVPAVSFFSHQRSFVVGGSILLLAVLLWLLYGRVNGNEHTSSRWLVLLGFLPFTHPHTFFAAIVFFGSVFFVKHVWGQRREVRDWLWWGAAAMAIALPQVLYLSRTGFLGEGAGKSFFKPWFGWMTCVHSRSWFFCDPNGVGVDTNPLFFWTKNFGVVFWGWLVVLVFLGLSGGGTKRMREWVVPSVALFLIPNLFLLQPWEFDNNKALFWWWTIALLLIFVVLREGEALVPRAAWAFIFGVLIFVGGFSGTVDVGARVRDAFFEARADSHFGFYGRPELEAARWINGNTAPNEAFLSSDGANNFVPMLSGRPIFLGFTGWLWTQGRNALVTERKALAQQFFVTKDPSALCDKGVRWLLWDPSLFNTYPQARWVGPRDLGEIKFSQDVFDGQRHIIKLKCSNLSN